MAKKEVTVREKPDCRKCKNGGEEFNFMCYCSVLNRNRAIGTLICNHYVRK